MIRKRQFETEHPAPSGWIQWKGTAVCVDLYCTCGAHLHYDGDFMYYIQCAHCKQHYECDGHITLHPIPHDEIAAAGNDICEPIPLRDEELTARGL